MSRPIMWRVRVTRLSEEWVDVSAHDLHEAERMASNLPRVYSVFVGSAIRGDEASRPEPPEGVQE